MLIASADIQHDLKCDIAFVKKKFYKYTLVVGSNK